MNNTLETRIKNIAANMEGNFTEVDGYEVPHSKFAEWDQTWDVADILAEDNIELSDESTDEEIEKAIRFREHSAGWCYEHKMQEYVKELRDAKFSKDPDAFDEQTVNALVDAFTDGADEVTGCRMAKSGMPYTSVLYEAARKVLEQEAKDHMVRQDALLEAREEQFHTFGYPSNNWSRPDADKCPVSLDEFDPAGGTYFMEDEEMSLEDGLRECMKYAYVDWFMDNTIRM